MARIDTNALAADARSLNGLKLQAGQNSALAIKDAAKQFESLFMSEMLKSMRAATESSVSGKPYLVRCGGAQPVPSQSWFNDKLKDLRAHAAGAGNY